MTNLDSSTPTQDERILAALSHVSVLIPMTGVIAPIIIWVTQREKSQYVAFQALQALIFQLGFIALWIIGMGCYMLSFIVTFIPILFTSPQTSHTNDLFFGLAFIVPLVVIGLIMLFGFIIIVYGVIAAVMAVQGKPFRYIIIGNRVKHFIGQKQYTAGPISVG